MEIFVNLQLNFLECAKQFSPKTPSLKWADVAQACPKVQQLTTSHKHLKLNRFSSQKKNCQEQLFPRIDRFHNESADVIIFYYRLCRVTNSPMLLGKTPTKITSKFPKIFRFLITHQLLNQNNKKDRKQLDSLLCYDSHPLDYRNKQKRYKFIEN